MVVAPTSTLRLLLAAKIFLQEAMGVSRVMVVMVEGVHMMAGLGLEPLVTGCASTSLAGTLCGQKTCVSWTHIAACMGNHANATVRTGGGSVL